MISEYVTLEQFVAVDEPGAEALASSSDGGSVIPAGGLVVFYGNGGAGKTTALIDAVMHFAAGIPWLGIVKPTRKLGIVWIENEGPRPEFRKKLGAKLNGWDGGSVKNRIHLYEHPWEEFSFANDVARAALVQRIKDTEADLVIASPVKAIGMQGGGTDDEIGEFLSNVTKVRSETGATIILVHHENRAGQISGAWESRPDTLVHVQAQGHGRTRLFWQKCRWSSEMHGTSTSLLWAPGESFTVEAREEITEDTIADGIIETAREIPGGSWSKIRGKFQGNDNDKAKVRDRLLAAGELVNTASREGYFNLWVADDPAATRAGLSTASARLSLASPEGLPEPSRARAGSIEHGARNGTAPQAISELFHDSEPEPVEELF